jgi:hypothetical protein
MHTMRAKKSLISGKNKIYEEKLKINSWTTATGSSIKI